VRVDECTCIFLLSWGHDLIKYVDRTFGEMAGT